MLLIIRFLVKIVKSYVLPFVQAKCIIKNVINIVLKTINLKTHLSTNLNVIKSIHVIILQTIWVLVSFNNV